MSRNIVFESNIKIFQFFSLYAICPSRLVLNINRVALYSEITFHWNFQAVANLYLNFFFYNKSEMKMTRNIVFRLGQLSGLRQFKALIKAL